MSRTMNILNWFLVRLGMLDHLVLISDWLVCLVWMGGGDGDGDDDIGGIRRHWWNKTCR